MATLALSSILSKQESDRDAPILRELAFRNYDWDLDERRAKFTLPLLAALTQYRREWRLNRIAWAFWRLRTAASLDRKGKELAFRKGMRDKLGSATFTSGIQEGISTFKYKWENVR